MTPDEQYAELVKLLANDERASETTIGNVLRAAKKTRRELTVDVTARRERAGRFNAGRMWSKQQPQSVGRFDDLASLWEKQ